MSDVYALEGTPCPWPVKANGFDACGKPVRPPHTNGGPPWQPTPCGYCAEHCRALIGDRPVNLNTIAVGDVLAELAKLPSDMFRTIVTSPPYNLGRPHRSDVERSLWPSSKIMGDGYAQHDVGWYGIDISAEYAERALERVHGDDPLARSAWNLHRRCSRGKL